MQSSRTLSVLLLLLCVVNAALAAIFLFDPATLSRIHQDAVLDNLHLMLSMSVGALLVVFAVGAVLAAFRPRTSPGIISLLILSYFSLFIVDTVSVARGEMALVAVLPQMAYFLVAASLLIRFFPVPQKEEKEKPKEPQIPQSPVQVAMENRSTGHEVRSTE